MLIKTIKDDITKITDVQAIVNAAKILCSVAEVLMGQFIVQQE